MARNANDLVNVIKQVSIDAVNSTVPVQIAYGTVTSDSPLRVQIDSKLVLESVHLDVVKSLSDYTSEISIGGGVKQQATFYNSLKLNDKVVMLRFQGGKRYLVIDRV